MFQLTDFTEARLASVTNRTEKHGDEDVPAVTLSTVITAANTLLDSIEPGLRHALYKPSMARQLPGVEPSTPVLRANCIDTVVLTTMHEGWRLLVDDGIDDTDPMTFDGVKVDKLRVDAKQGGSIELTMLPGHEQHRRRPAGQAGHAQREEHLGEAAEARGEAGCIDGSVESFKRDHPEFGDGPDATDLFAAGTVVDAEFADPGVDGQDEGDPDEFTDDEGAQPDLEDRLDGALTQADKEQAELEAGMAASIKDAGVKPARRGRRTAAVE